MSQTQDLAGLIYVVLKKSQPLTLQELAAQVDASTEHVRLALADLGADGIRVWSDSQGKLSISSKTFPDFTQSAEKLQQQPSHTETPDPTTPHDNISPATEENMATEVNSRTNPLRAGTTTDEAKFSEISSMSSSAQEATTVKDTSELTEDHGATVHQDFLSSQERGEVPPTAKDSTSPADTTGQTVAEDNNANSPHGEIASGETPDTVATGNTTLPATRQDSSPAAAAPDLEALRAQKLQEKAAEENPEQRPLTLMGHLNELRSRLTRCVIAALLGFVACYGVADVIFAELMRPLTAVLPADSKLIFTALPEAFFTYMRVAFVAGVFLSSPYIFYQIWAFIAPGLYDEEKRYAIPIAIASALFFIGGACFCYFIVFPFAFTFFMGFSTDIIQAMPSLGEYLSFTLKLLLAFGLIFEMPLFTFFLSRMGLLTAGMMRSVRRYAILAIFIVAAILTPPDVMSQLLMAGPMILLYELSILIAVVFGRKSKQKPTDEPAEEEQQG